MKNNILKNNLGLCKNALLFCVGVFFPFYVGASLLFLGVFMNWFGLVTVLVYALFRDFLFSSGARPRFFEGMLIISVSLLLFIIKKYIRKNTKTYEFI